MVSPASDQPTTRQLDSLGQSVWLDYIQRSILTSGRLATMVRDGWVTGMTTNPTIFEKALADSADYEASLRAVAATGDVKPYDAFLSLAIEDIRGAAAALRPVYERTAKVDGFVSLEEPPGIEFDTAASIAEGRRLFELAGEPNVMIKVPGTPEGIAAVPALIEAGVNVNVTLLFSVAAYEKTAEAYIEGLERRLAAGKPLDGIAGVASFFVSRVDTAVDAVLPADSPLRGKIAVANARRAYRRFREIFSTERWARLAAAGAHVQRPLWASTGTKNPKYSDLLYVEELIAPDTVNTMPEATLKAALDHLDVRMTLEAGTEQAEQHLNALAAAGVDLDAVTAKLLTDGLASFEKDFLKLLRRVESSIALAQVGRWQERASLGSLEAAVRQRLVRIDAEKVVERIWKLDQTVWKPDPTEITDRLGWLTVSDDLHEQAAELAAFAGEVRAAGFTTAVLLGMGGSSLAPEVFHSTFGSVPDALDLRVLDATDPDQISAIDASLDVAKTLFIVASKSGGTVETLSHLAYFWAKAPNGAQFVAITDPGSGLETLARERGFRRVFVNPPEIGGRYSALSYFGLVPAALIGVDLDRLLSAAHKMIAACAAEVPAADHPGAWLGAIMGEAAVAGRDKLTLVLPPELASLGYWIEQLVAESTGKEGRGILPVEGEDLGAPGVYGPDRLFVAVGEHPKLKALEAAGHPVVYLPEGDPYTLGATFFRWEFATAVAGYVLEVNPFDQPNVQEAKDATNRILSGAAVDTQSPPAATVLAELKPGGYLAITAYVPRNAQWSRQLQDTRMRLRDRYKVATTTGFGPRFLHSTGQMHKGGPNEGVFLQVVSTAAQDLEIPGKPFTFARLKEAQAAGDLAALKDHGRRVARLDPAEFDQLGR